MKYSFKILLNVACVLITGQAAAQNVAINSTGATANASSILDISSTTSGLLIPRMTSAQKTALNPLPAAAQGLVIYQTDGIQGFYYNSSTTTTPSWNFLSPNGWSLTGNAGTIAGTNCIGTTDAVDWVIKTNSTEQVRVLSGGNVGIGTTAPTQRLDVQNGNARINNTFLGDVGHGSGWGGISHSSMNSTTGYGLIQSSDGAYTLINKQNTGSGYIGFRVANSDVAVITNAGNMGLGLTGPVYKLTVTPGATFGFGDGHASYSSRTESRADAGLQGSSGAQSGFFQTSAPSPSANWPTSTASATAGFDGAGNAQSWWHLIDVRHSNDGNNYAMQFSGSFFDQRLYFRKTNGSATTAWSEVLTSSATIGQSSTTSYSNAAISLPNGGGYYYAPGFPITVNVPANSTVLITADIGGQTQSLANGGASLLDVALMVDGVIVNDGGYHRLSLVNNANMIGAFEYASFSQSFSSLSAGNHTFALVGACTGGTAVTFGGNNSSVLQGELTVTIIKK
jgi:hypothetical protein